MNRGIFWIIDKDDLANNDPYLFKIKTDMDGNVLDHELPLNSRNHNNYAHKATWHSLPFNLTHNKPYNYYPRGRIEIRNGVCKIYLNPELNRQEIVRYLLDEFELQEFDQIKVIEDYSEHYKSHSG